jgi:N-hydroxyarylamine O-acetyltransferase
MDDTMLRDYLQRIEATRPVRPDLNGLRHLQERQIMTVPFENLDYHLADRLIVMDERVLDKIVRERRGGGCYETNPALGFLLAELGYRVRIHPGRVFRYGRIGPPMCHLVLRVDLDERWLVDTGFGRNSLYPLRLDSRDPQEDPNGVYQLVDAEDGGIDLMLDGKPLYRVDDRPAVLDDFRPTLQWYRTAPDSPFVQDLFCSLRTETGRVTLKGRKLTIVDGAERVTQELTDDSEVLAGYEKYFGISLTELPNEPDVATRGVQI